MFAFGCKINKKNTAFLQKKMITFASSKGAVLLSLYVKTSKR